MSNRKLAEVYTLQNLADGSWATWSTAEGKAGTWILSVLCSRENSEVESYQEVARAAFLSDDSLQLVIFSEVMPRRAGVLNFLPHALIASGIRVRGYETGAGVLPDTFRFLPATRCVRCGRMLTVPTSIDSGMGEICSGHKPRAGSKYRAAKGLTPEEMRKRIEERTKERNATKRFKLPRK